MTELSRGFLERALNLSLNGIYVYDLSRGVNVYVNDQYTALTGYTMADLNGMSPEEFFSLFHPAEHAMIAAHMEAVASSEVGCCHDIEYQFKKSDGSWMWCLSRDVVFEQDSSSTVTQFLGSFVDITDRIQAARELEELNLGLESLVQQRTDHLNQRLEENRTLLREVHHRVKNNLQVITSLLSLQGSLLEDRQAKEALRVGQLRINSMAIAHELLYHSEGLASVDLQDYLERLIGVLTDTFLGVGSSQIEARVEVGGARLDIDTAIQLGLLVNEIVTNSLKHGFTDTRPGQLYVSVSPGRDGRHVLKIGDDGAGFPDGVGFSTSTTLGLRLIQRLSTQLGGQLKRETGPTGTHYSLAFARHGGES